MFHLQSLELLHWDYCRRVSMPLDGNIITIAGPNGSGKTTLLDAMRTLLGLECSGGRTYKTYARHANAEHAWLRALVDNRPRGRQNRRSFSGRTRYHGPERGGPARRPAWPRPLRRSPGWMIWPRRRPPPERSRCPATAGRPTAR